MRIESLAVRLPSKRMSNSDLLASIRAVNADIDRQLLERYCGQLTRLFRRAGAGTRFYRDGEAGETAISLIVDAVDRAIREAHVERSDVNLLIYCGVGRGFAEPSSAAFVLQALGMRCDGFDVLEACMSWVRALQIAYSFLSNGAYSRILIVNGEFNVYEYGFPEVLKIKAPDQLPYVFPSFTIGEAASATVVVPSDARWRFSFSARPDLAHLCSLPLPGYAQFSLPNKRIGLAGTQRLVAFGAELADAGLAEILQLVTDTIPDPTTVDWFFPHVPGHSICKLAARRLRLGARVICDGFCEYGNLVSASLPASMWRMLKRSLLRRGHRVVLCPASAGMSFGVVEFVY